jgi:hypothetical protein
MALAKVLFFFFGQLDELHAVLLEGLVGLLVRL